MVAASQLTPEPIAAMPMARGARLGAIAGIVVREVIMRRASVCAVLVVSASVLALGAATAQRAPTTGAAPPGISASATPPAQAPAPGPQPSGAKCTNPNALGVSRTVEIDTTG